MRDQSAPVSRPLIRSFLWRFTGDGPPGRHWWRIVYRQTPSPLVSYPVSDDRRPIGPVGDSGNVPHRGLVHTGHVATKPTSGRRDVFPLSRPTSRRLSDFPPLPRQKRVTVTLPGPWDQHLLQPTVRSSFPCPRSLGPRPTLRRPGTSGP